MSNPQSHVLSLFLKFSCAASISGRHEKNWDDFREVMISGLIWRSLWGRDHFGSYISPMGKNTVLNDISIYSVLDFLPTRPPLTIKE